MLTLAGVAATYGQAAVLHDLSFEVAEAEVLVLLGRNGMGKTSAMRSIMGWDAPQVTDGSIRFDGRQLRGLPPHQVAAAGLGYVPQGRMVFPSLTVEENLLVADRAGGRSDARWTLPRVYELFPRLADRSRQRAATLSGGEQQMLVIGRALMTNPRLLLLDEPSEGLAPTIVRQVGETVTELRREGMSILVAEQDVRFAIGLADRVAILERGHVVAHGTPEEIDADDELKRRHLGMGTSEPEPATTGDEHPAAPRRAAPAVTPRPRDVSAPRRRPRRRIRPTEVTRVSALLGGRPWHARLFSNGWSETTAGAHTIIEPATGAILGEVALAGRAEVLRAARLAAAAQREWAGAGPSARAEVLADAGGRLAAHAEEIVGWLVREAGTTTSAATAAVTDLSRWLARVASLTDDPGALLSEQPAGGIDLARRAPHGVVGVITPVDDPLALATRSVAAALVLGNAVLLSCDPRTAVSGGVALARILEEAGLPQGVLHVLPAHAEGRRALAASEDVDALSFTGAVSDGREVAEEAGRRPIGVSLRLAGTHVHLVLDDADIERAAEAGARSAFSSGGLSCLSSSRHLVHESVVADYAALLSRRASRLEVGDPHLREVDLGPLIDDARARRSARLVRATVEAGAEHRVGGSRHGAFMPPTVLTDVAPGTDAFTAEALGPVAPVATFGSEAEAAELAEVGARTRTVAIHTGRSGRGLTLARRLSASSVRVDGGDGDLLDAGSVGEAGTDHLDARRMLESFSRWQRITAG